MSETMDREEILRRFETWLDRTLASEDPPRGVAAEILSSLEDDGEEPDRQCDTYALWAAITAATQEVKLQGRTFKQLSDTVAAQTERIGLELHSISEERERELKRETERRCRKEILGALIDLRDRFGRGLDSALAGHAELEAGARANWVRRLVTSSASSSAIATIGAMVKGYALTLERLDQTLADFNAREIRCQGELFDPRTMNAIDREETTSVPEGTVVEVYRSGYEWNGEVFRPAEVKVAYTLRKDTKQPSSSPRRPEGE